MDLNQWKTDREAENSGVRVVVGMNGKGEETTITLRSADSDEYKKVVTRLFAPYQIQMNLGRMDEDLARNLINQAMAEGLVVDWENFTEDGKPVKFSVETCKRALDEIPRFRKFVKEKSEDIETFKAKEELETVKN